MDPVRINETSRVEVAPKRARAEAGGGPAFEDVLREVDQDLDRLQALANDAHRVASDEGPGDPESFREAVRDSEEALKSARRIRSRLLGAYQATQGGAGAATAGMARTGGGN